MQDSLCALKRPSLQDPRLPDKPVAMAITPSTPRKDREQTASLPTVSPIRTQIMIADAVETSEASGAQQKKKQPFKCESTGPVKAKRTLYMKV